MFCFLLTLFSQLVDPLVGSIAQQFLSDRKTHDRIAAEWTRRYAVAPAFAQTKDNKEPKEAAATEPTGPAVADA
jgi:hypothetical protein